MRIRLLLLLSAVSFACACANKTVGPDYNSVRQRSDQAQQDLDRQSSRPGQ